MSDIKLIEDAWASITAYTKSGGRLGLSDLILYDTLVNMYESDMEDSDPYLIWLETPDHIFQKIVSDNEVSFDTRYGWESYDESIREYLTAKNLVVNSDDLEDEEYQQLLEGEN